MPRYESISNRAIYSGPFEGPFLLEKLDAEMAK
jgi:hypothetical protein